MAEIVENTHLSDQTDQYPAVEAVQLKIELTSVINYALQQNRIPLIQELLICNNGASDIENALVKLRCEPDLVCADQINITAIPAGTTFTVNGLRPQVNASFMADLTERIVGQLYVTLENVQGEVLSEQVCEITALAFDEWHGTAFYPELLSAFVTPNHPEVTKITARAAQLLGGWSGDPSLNAYQTQNPNRVLMQAAAVYGALQEVNIIYSVPPASFERIGQRVRLCDAVIQQKMGTCLDLTLFYAACLEAIGLHPILLLQQGHIFAGVWLEDLSFSESVENDPSLITKRIAEGVNEIAVVECTALVSGKNMSFDEAMAAAVSKLHDPDPLEYIIDVSRSRLSGIRPLPMRIQGEIGWIIETPKRSESELTHIPGALGETVHVGKTITEKTWSKMAQWERKLLDLSLRNTLVNLKWTQSVIPILSDSLSALEDALSGGDEYGISPRPSEWMVSEERRRSIENLTDLGMFKELIKSEFQNKRLRSFLSEGELSRAILNVYRSSKTSMEENGANTLYLALGFLRWYETTASQKPRYAPLILLPVEIIRKSALKGYVIRLRDEDPQMNITLLQMLTQDFGIQIQGLDPLPQDAQGIDLRTVFTVIRKAVMDQPRWDVVPAAFLGVFSFSQFVMWNDLRNRSEDLQKNKIVHSLIEGHLTWDAQEMTPGEKVSEDDSLVPVPVDASQLYAIQAAAEGKSFVLHGPPGTGKSQTITAIIANALAKGKSVLFVAEKMAALSVVQQRLRSIGIGPFCLELHSNKSNKRDVLNQLNEAAQVAKQASPSIWLKKTEQVAQLRKDLDVYAQALHERQKSGLSLFEMISKYTEYADCQESVQFSRAFADSIDEDIVQNQQLTLNRLIASARLVGHPHQHPLRNVGKAVYTQQLRNALPEHLSEYISALHTLSASGTDLAKKLDLPEPQTFFDWENLYQIASQLQVWIPLPRAWGKDADWARSSTEIQKMAYHFQTALTLYDELSACWEDGFFSLDAAMLKSEWAASLAKWAIPKLLQQSKLVKGIKPFWKAQTQKLSKDSIVKTFSDLVDYQSNLAEGQRLFERYGAELGNLYSDSRTDWEKIMVYARDAKRSDDELSALSAGGIRIAFAGVPELFSFINGYIEAFKQMLTARDRTYNLLEIVADEQSDGNWVSIHLEMCENIRGHSDDLKEWMIWVDSANEAERLGLEPLVFAYKKGLTHDSVEPAYYKGLYTALIHKTIEDNSALNSFSGMVFHEKIRQFQKLDEELSELAKKEVFYRLASQIPNFTQEASQKSEVGVLQRAIRSGGRGVSIRRLFEQISNLLLRLCPCMLMSPLSAAQYLSPDRKPFDLVIFDEASQMPTARAVGALARGIDAVIVGDPKQMPPTSFFAGNSLDEDNLESEDLESILDDALALNMPQSHLLWHYRSRHESLIAFSNYRFYENKLYTFPSINDRESKVTLLPVEGFFDRGKTRQNRAEAEAVVRELVRRSQDSSCSNQSVGVVSFNIQQQNLIDDLFTEACKTDPELERWAYESQEPLFIKNLENVQGDERDIILFSIGYGPDAAGKTYMNFGPLNREGGWRRLNVAVSRARQEMKVFASIQADQIDLSRSSAEGVAALKAFLEYASGKSLYQNDLTLSGTGNKAGIALELKRRLEQDGYQAELQVGHSKYKIDLGIVDPKNPSRYLLGVLLDGPVYKDSKTTRDREISQVNVLTGLGWRIHRLWSVDWWDNSNKEFGKIIELLKEPMSCPDPLQPKISLVTEGTIHTEIKQKLASPVCTPQVLPIPSAPEPRFKPYQPAVLPTQPMTPDEYLLPQKSSIIKKALQMVLELEAPISESLLTRRVVQSFGISRAGSRIQQRTMQILHGMPLICTKQGDKSFYWISSQNPDAYRGLRVSNSGIRDADDIPIQEIANAVCVTLEQQVAMPKEDLLRETANLLGYSRLGNVVISSITTGIEYAINKGQITEQKNDYYVLS